jgi:hypothetical protein
VADSIYECLLLEWMKIPFMVRVPRRFGSGKGPEGPIARSCVILVGPGGASLWFLTDVDAICGDSSR